MWLIAGTVPQADFPLTFGPCTVQASPAEENPAEENPLGSRLHVGGHSLPVERGTAALAAAAWLYCAAHGQPARAPHLLLAGDTGKGEGSRAVYAWLVEHGAALAAEQGLRGITFHYLFPDVDWHNRVLMALEALPQQPMLVADAGFMYVAKMSGYADSYDLFTPDVGEMAFLADENAPHPFYTRGFLLATEDDIPSLIARAHSHGNCARHLIVKGAKDYVVTGKDIVHTVDSPSVPAMEAIGGTGDIVTGTVTALLALGQSLPTACLQAAQASRLLAQIAQPSPATQVGALLRGEYVAAVVKGMRLSS